MIANQTTYKVFAFLKQHCWCPGLCGVLVYVVPWSIWCPGLYSVLVYMVSWSIWCPGLCAWTEVSTVTVEINGVLKPQWINCSSVHSCCFELFCTWYCVLTLLIYKLYITMLVGCVLSMRDLPTQACMWWTLQVYFMFNVTLFLCYRTFYTLNSLILSTRTQIWACWMKQ